MPKVTVSSTATKIASSNDRRISILVQNSGSQTVYLGKNDSITASEEPYISSDGVYQEDNSGGQMWLGDIYGITSTGTADIVYWERSGN